MLLYQGPGLYLNHASSFRICSKTGVPPRGTLVDANPMLSKLRVRKASLTFLKINSITNVIICSTVNASHVDVDDTYRQSCLFVYSIQLILLLRTLSLILFICLVTSTDEYSIYHFVQKHSWWVKSTTVVII